MNERELFAEAMEKDTDAERATYLEKACGDDLEMRQRIEDLIREQAELGSFLESSPLGVAATSDFGADIAQPGSQVGPYKLLQKIGEGGFGTVFMAFFAIMNPVANTPVEPRAEAIARDQHSSCSTWHNNAGDASTDHSFYRWFVPRSRSSTVFGQNETKQPIERGV